MSEDEYIELRKKELHLVTIEIAKKDKEKGFNILLNSPFALLGFPKERYRVSELALRLLDKEKIKYKVLP